MRSCSVGACDRPHAAQGYCHTHYRRARYRGMKIIQPHVRHGDGSVSRKGYARYGHKEVHRLRAERALGGKLPHGAVVHHTDSDKDNPNARLVVCPSQEYHHLLHRRTEALEACGDPEARKCRFCHKYGHLMKDNMYVGNGGPHHRNCRNAAERAARRRVE